MIIFLSSGCSHMQIHVRDEIKDLKPAKILIGEFSTRDINYDPFIADVLRESVGFELFSAGYNVVMWKRNENDKKKYDSPAEASGLCTEHAADLLITGVLSRKEGGSFADRKIYYSVTFFIRDRNGLITGEANYSDDDVDAPVFVKDASSAFVDELISRLNDE